MQNYSPKFKIEKETLKEKAASGAVILVVKRVLIQAVFFLSNIALARILFPQDFGTFAIVVFVITFFAVFTDLGLGPSLVQKKEELGVKDLQTAFTFNLALSVMIVLVIFLTAPVIASFYDLGEKGVTLFRLYSLYLLFLPSKTASGAILERNLEYQKLVIIEVSEIATTAITTVVFALLGFGVLSFGVGAVIGHAISAVLYFAFSPWRVALTISKKNLKNLAKFGIPFQSQIWFGLFFGPAILLYLGKVVGAQNLGFYQFAASLATIPLAGAEIITRIAFPLGARLQKDRIFFRQIIERSLLVVSLTSLPIVAIILATAPFLIHFIYTDRWLPALPALYFSLLQMAIISYTGIFTQLLLSLGKAYLIRNISFVWAVLTWILAPPLIFKFNFVGMSLAGLLVSLTGIWLIIRMRQEVNFSFWSNFSPFLINAVIAALAAYVFINSLPQTFLNLIFSLIIGGIFYLGLTWVFERKKILSNLQALTALFKKV